MVERFHTLKCQRIAEVLAGLEDEDLASLVRIQEKMLAGAGPAAPSGAAAPGGAAGPEASAGNRERRPR